MVVAFLILTLFCAAMALLTYRTHITNRDDRHPPPEASAQYPSYKTARQLRDQAEHLVELVERSPNDTKQIREQIRSIEDTVELLDLLFWSNSARRSSNLTRVKSGRWLRR